MKLVQFMFAPKDLFFFSISAAVEQVEQAYPPVNKTKIPAGDSEYCSEDKGEASHS